MAKTFTRTEIKQARRPKCSWSEERIEAAIGARFPGSDDVELAELISAWLADDSLSRGTLGQCCNLAAKLAGDGYHSYGLWINPRKTLEVIQEGLKAGAPVERVNRKAQREAARAAELAAAVELAVARAPTT